MNEARRRMVEEYQDFRVDVPEGEKGMWAVRRVKMDERSVLIHNTIEKVLKTDRVAIPGVYTLLIHTNMDYQETVVMSDHQCEVADHEPLLAYARSRAPLGHVLINGLGLGVAIKLLMRYVEQFTIVELNPEVIDLVGPHYQQLLGDRLTIIQHDALTYRPPKGAHYDAVFHDIWNFIDPNNLAEMRHLHRRYGRLCDWQGSWARRYCERRERLHKLHPEDYVNAIPMSEAMRQMVAAIEGKSRE